MDHIGRVLDPAATQRSHVPRAYLVYYVASERQQLLFYWILCSSCIF